MVEIRWQDGIPEMMVNLFGGNLAQNFRNE